MEIMEHPILATIPEQVRGSLSLEIATFRQGDQIYSAGQAIDKVYFLTLGEVQLIHRDVDQGLRSVADTLRPGDVVGGQVEEGAPVSRYDVEALCDVEAAAMPNKQFRTLVLRSAQFSRGLLLRNAVKSRVLEERALAQKDVDVSRVVFNEDLIALIPAKYMMAKKVIPMAMHGGTVTVATASDDIAGIEADMRRLLNAQRVRPYRVSPKVFERVFRDAVQKNTAIAVTEDEATWFQAVRNKDYNLEFESPVDIRAEASLQEMELDGSGVVRLLNKIIGEALDLGASDIHFEPFPGALDVRFRFDGELMLRPEKVAATYLNAVLSRIKVLAGMDIAERRKPQDGRLTINGATKTVDVRISTIPTRFGEKIVLRILDPTSMLIDLDQLVVGKETLDALRWMVEQPCGLILVAGPTGSGKTTTVYSMLLEKKREPVNIVTIEDPIEYMVHGITQVQRNPHVDLDFPNAVRSFLRQDPDVIIVGETRDPETARAALEAGLTGHLVITTVHANNVFASAYRLKEMGMEAFVIANSVIGVLSQRLVRRLCPRCSETVQYHRRLIDPMGLPGLPPAVGDYYVFRRGKGCASCNFRGYRGRVALFETLRIPDELKAIMAADTSFTEVEAAAREVNAYLSMAEYASMLLNAGVTTPEELSRVLFIEGA